MLALGEIGGDVNSPGFSSTGGLWASMILVALIIYVGGYAIGIGNVAWQQSE